MKYLFPFIIILTFFSACRKGEDFKNNVFPGYTGAGTEATWVVNRHTITDVAYVTNILPTQTPPTSYVKFDSTYNAARQREVSPVSYKFYINGEIATIINNVWVKQPTLKWEIEGDQMKISKNNNGTWISIAIGYKDEEKLLIKYKKTYFGDTSIDKERFVMEVFYSIF